MLAAGLGIGKAISSKRVDHRNQLLSVTEGKEEPEKKESYL